MGAFFDIEAKVEKIQYKMCFFNHRFQTIFFGKEGGGDRVLKQIFCATLTSPHKEDYFFKLEISVCQELGPMNTDTGRFGIRLSTCFSSF
jgi:hypothetical protein